jgi:hypothetical protein
LPAVTVPSFENAAGVWRIPSRRVWSQVIVRVHDRHALRDLIRRRDHHRSGRLLNDQAAC